MKPVALLAGLLCCWPPASGTEFGVSLGSGTAVVALRASGVLLAAVDSQENYTFYRDGQTTTERREVCKVARPGPFFAIVAGIDHSSNGFDARAELEKAWRGGDSLDDFAARVRTAIPVALRPVLQEVLAADPGAFLARFRGQTALQVLLIGTERKSPQPRIVEFLETGSAGLVELSVRERGCPRDCAASRSAWFLGTHDHIDQAVRGDSGLLARADEQTAERLIGLEYEARPDIVGGPVSIIRAGPRGAELVRAGACGARSSP